MVEHAHPSVAVAIPAYNEEGIAGFLRDIDGALAAPGRSVSIHVVDDRSTDDTLERVRAVSGELSAELDLSVNERNMGHGPTCTAAYRRALDSGADYVLQVDGDGQFVATDMRRLIEQLDAGADVTVGLRRNRVDPWFRKALSLALRGWVWVLFGVWARDPNCPFRAYRREALDILLAKLPEHPLVPTVYLTALAGRHGMRVAAIEVEHQQRRGTSAQGTMWGRRRSLFIPRRLVKFVGQAWRESTRFALEVRFGLGRPQRRFLMVLALLIGIAARFVVAARGHNYDLESYQIVGHIVTHGGNVYRDTPRYNYGPPWFVITGALYRLTFGMGLGFVAFRYAVTAFLTLVDLCIMAVVGHRYGRSAAALFFLNPVSIIITGFHSQFDNVAVLLGLVAVGLLAPGAGKPGTTRREYRGLVVLGLSLMVKHILLVFPLWVALRKPDLRSRITALAVPVAVFGAGFLPFWWSARQGIMDHVVNYRSTDNAPLLRLLLGPGISRGTVVLVFVVVLVAAGIALARAKFRIDHALLVYLVLAVAFAPAIANQYLAILIATAAVLWSLPFLVYSVYALLYLAQDSDGMHISRVPELFGRHGIRTYGQLCLLALVGLALGLWRRGSRFRDAAEAQPVREEHEHLLIAPRVPSR